MQPKLELSAKDHELVHRVRTNGEEAVLLALGQVKTPEGVLRIRNAELLGLRRPNVLRFSDRRMAEIFGQEPVKKVKLVADASFGEERKYDR